MRRRTILAVAVAAVVLAGCRPGTTPGTPESIWRHDDTYQAIDAVFAPYGPTVVACAHAIVDRESGHWPYSGIGRTYQGPWQMHPGFDGTIAGYAAVLGHIASRHDPWLSTLAARDAFVMYGGTFRRNWPGTTPAGCP